MKKAEEYFDYMSSEDDIIDLYNKSKEDFIKAIKQAQIDAVEYAVKMCAKEAETNRYTNQGSKILVDKQSIFNVADKIKKEL